MYLEVGLATGAVMAATLVLRRSSRHTVGRLTSGS